MRNLLISSLMFAFTSSAFAADAIVEESLPARFSWTGAYIGVQGAYVWGDGKYSFLDSDINSSPSPDGVAGGVYLGYNYQLPSQLVIGIDADVLWSSGDDSAPGYLGDGTMLPFPMNAIVQDVKWTAAARLRLGYALDRWLPYVAGGVAFADVDQTISSFFDPVEFDATYTGWTIGGGAEYAFTDNLILRGEYRYTDFGKENFPNPINNGNLEWTLKTHDIRLGIAYRF